LSEKRGNSEQKASEKFSARGERRAIEMRVSKQKGRPAKRGFCFAICGGNCFFASYYQDTKPSLKIGQNSLTVL
jgi:hypothetical protein